MTIFYYLIFVFLLFTTAQGAPQQKKDRKVSLEDIHSDEFASWSFNLQWIDDRFTYERDGFMWLVHPRNTSEKEALFSKEAIKEFRTSKVSPTLENVLGSIDLKMKWRHSYNALYKIKNKEGKEVNLHQEFLNYASWSLDGKYLSYVHDNSLYVTNNLEDPPSGEITIMTSPDESVFVGIPDWVYEEEILGDRVSHWWAPGGQRLCFSRIDNHLMGTQHWLLYGDKDNVIETVQSIPYPKAGLQNAKVPIATLHVAALDWPNRKVQSVQLLPPPELANTEHYFLQVEWINDEKVFVTWCNRKQTRAYHVYYHLTNPADEHRAILIYEETAGEGLEGWLEVPPIRPFFPSGDETHIISVQAHKTTSHGTWRHLVSHKKSADGIFKQEFLMEGAFEVTGLLKLRGDHVYFIRTGKNSRERKLFKLNLQDKSMEDISPEDCSYMKASFSHSGDYFLRTCLGPSVPSYVMDSVDEEYEETVYEDNRELEEALKSKDTVRKHYINTDKIYMELYKPEVESGKKLPLLVYTYAGPGTQEVSERMDWGSHTKNWLLHVASWHDVAVASIDGRGTSGNGEELKLQMYQKLGDVEVADQIEGIRLLASREDIDENNIAIFGWSYGGFTAASALADSNLVKCAISVAPVTNQGLYDTAYAERFLGLFKENPQVYNKTNLQYRAAKMANKKLLVAHGTADDNVHFTNFAHLIRELELNNILFTQLTYPDEAHSISDRQLNKHLFHSLDHFITSECFQLPSSSSSSSSSRPLEPFIFRIFPSILSSLSSLLSPLL